LVASWDFQGHASEYWLARDREVLNDGPARCGKTLCELFKLRHLCEEYPGSRHLLARETRKALTESVLADFENHVLGPGHPVIGRMRRSHRDAYRWPNGSAIILHGLDTPDHLLSMEVDTALVVQAEQLHDQSIWDGILSRLSGRACGFQQGTLDVNPAGQRHWIIKRAKEVLCLSCGAIIEPERTDCQRCHSLELGRMRHLRWTHHDNPLLFDVAARDWTPFGREYLTRTLGRLRGVRRKRLLEGLWVSEEGLIIEDYDPEVHRISGRLERLAGGWMLTVTSPGWAIGSKDPMREARVHLDWFGAGADFGWSPDPGVLQVWGYDRHGRRFRVAEVYRLKKHLDWWAGVAAELYNEFRFRYIAVDPSAPALKDALNIRLGPIAGREGPMIAISADNTVRQQKPDLAGIDLMRWGFSDDKGVVRTFLLRDSTRHGIDPELHDAGRATSFEDELPEWVFDRRKSDDQQLAGPSDDCDDHACAAARYEGNEGWGRRHSATVGPIVYPEGSRGAIHDHAAKIAKSRARREAAEG
jgi:hypothetical protein